MKCFRFFKNNLLLLGILFFSGLIKTTFNTVDVSEALDWPIADINDIFDDLTKCFNLLGNYFPEPEILHISDTKKIFILDECNCMHYFYSCLDKYVQALKNILEVRYLLEDELCAASDPDFKDFLTNGPYFFMDNCTANNVKNMLSDLTDVKIWLNKNVAAQEEVHFIQQLIEKSNHKLNRIELFQCPLSKLKLFTEKCLLIGILNLLEIITRVDSLHRLFFSEKFIARDECFQTIFSTLQTRKKQLTQIYNSRLDSLRPAKKYKFISSVMKYYCYGLAMSLFVSSIAASYGSDNLNA